jgi:HEAT repeat protein
VGKGGQDGRRLPERQVDSAPGIEQLWSHLAEHDSHKAYQAIATLAAAPKEASALLKDRLRPALAPDPDRIQRLIANLDNDDFEVRETASAELEKIGGEALPFLRAAIENGPSLEVRRRAERLVTIISQRPLAAEWMRGVRAVQVLERIGSQEAKSILTQLAKGGTKRP